LDFWGALAQLNCIHVFWDICLAHLQGQCKGKENFSSLVFEVVASHTKKLLSVPGVQYGIYNDKTIFQSDSAILHIRKEHGILKQSNFKCCKEDSSVVKEKGYFYIVDQPSHKPTTGQR
jgi:hypothetical protein